MTTSPSTGGVCGLRVKYTFKVYIILSFIVIDLALNTVIDSQSEQISVIAEMATQGVLRILSLFVIFLFMWETFLFKYGLLGLLCQRFKLLFLIFPISFIFLVAARIFRGTQLFQDKNTIEVWQSSNYHGVYVVHNLLSICYYVALLQATFDLGNPSFYKASTWLDRV